MSCSTSLAKIFLFVFNIIFFLFGVGSLSLGIFLLVDKTSLLGLLTNVPGATETVTDVINKVSFLTTAAYILIVVGAVVLVVGFCGCCGALRENKCLLYTYAIIIIVIVVLEVTAGVLGYFYKAKAETYMQSYLVKLVTAYYVGSTTTSSGAIVLPTEQSGVSLAIDFANVYFGCCGVYNYTDFANLATKWPATYSYSGGTLTGAAVPISCCKMTPTSSFPYDLASIKVTNAISCLVSADPAATNLQGCYSKIRELIVNHSTVVLGVGIGLACAELLGILCACCLIKSISKGSNVVH